MVYGFVGNVAFWLCFLLLCLLDVVLVSVTNSSLSTERLKTGIYLYLKVLCRAPGLGNRALQTAAIRLSAASSRVCYTSP